MKKVTFAVLFSVVVLMSSCGSTESKIETPMTDSTKVDSVTVVVDTVKVDTLKTN